MAVQPCMGSIPIKKKNKKTLTLINDLVIKRMERTTTHKQPITESVVNNEEDARHEDSSFSADSSTAGLISCKTTKTKNS